MGMNGNSVSILSIPGERFTPFSLAKKLGARAVLESASFKKGKERYSILLLDEAFRIIQEADQVAIEIDGKRSPWVWAEQDVRIPSSKPRDILDALSEVAQQNSAAVPHLPVPGAGIGFLGYEFVRRCDTVQLTLGEDALGIPEAEFIVGHLYIIVDHYTDMLHLVGLNYAQHRIDLKKALAQVRARLDDLDFTYLAPPDTAVSLEIASDEEADTTIFCRGVENLQRHIVAGDIIQAVLSRRLICRSDLNALEGYRRLRSTSPSPYMFYLNFGSYALVGASPESLVRLRDGVASIRPIAGTRRRGATPNEDAILETELLKDPKERAEHLMLVDLARNDLGRVCLPGSVTVTRNMEVERFSHVMHIVSEVEGTPDPAISPAQVLRSAFPAGTVSGAPKLRAIELVSQEERYRRSFYAGAVGYFDVHGGFDTCITIRSALVKDGSWYLQAGAGIVHASKPEREWEETNEKLAALRAALGMAPRGGTR
jgi:anthranilate synthase component 1